VTVHQAAIALAAFLASLVECVEALTVVLAVGSVRGWRNALSGAAAAFLVLGTALALTGSRLPAPSRLVLLAVGLLTLLFGLRWLRKAILRSAGLLPLHDENAVFQSATRRLRHGAAEKNWDFTAIGTSFQVVMMEGVEVAFIVRVVGASAGALLPAALGALAALLCVVALGVALHRPIASIPENTLKFLVGVLLTAFGTFWCGEALRVSWPGGEWALPLMSLAWLAAASGLARAMRPARPARIA
jgi:uncharacterized membrane protein